VELFNISKHLGSCVLFRASCKLGPEQRYFKKLIFLNQEEVLN